MVQDETNNLLEFIQPFNKHHNFHASVTPYAQKHNSTEGLCAMMLTPLPALTSSWVLVPTEQAYELEASYLCQKPMWESSQSTQTQDTTVKHNINVNLKCEVGFFLFKAKCIGVYYSEYTTFPNLYFFKYNESTPGGNYNPETSLFKTMYIYLVGLMQMNTCFQIKYGSFDPHDALFIQDVDHFNFLKLRKNIHKIYIQANKRLINNLDENICSNMWFLIEQESTEVNISYQLKSNRFVHRCASGYYIASLYVCDGVLDCVEDHSDEEGCSPLCIRPGMSDHEYSCDQCVLPACKCLPSYYQCTTGGCIQAYKVCDFHKDCKDGSDEDFCHHLVCDSNHEYSCASGQCIPEEQRCDLVENCIDGTDETNCYSNECHGFVCNDETCIHRFKKGNLVFDCPHGEDEIEYLDVMQNPIKWAQLPINCSEFEIPCYPGHSMCLQLDNICTYDIEIDGSLKFCGNGAHLQYCEKMECPRQGMFKCQNAYCIHVYRLCDGTVDCPQGDDEKECALSGCPEGFFKCRESRKCIFPDNVCDGNVHCTHHEDDEIICSQIQCPTGCKCSLLLLQCIEVLDLSLYSISYGYIEGLRELMLHSISIDLIKKIIVTGKLVRRVVLQHNNMTNLEEIKPLQKLHYLYYLDLSNNQLVEIQHDFIRNIINLRYLLLESNFIFQISVDSLCMHNNGLVYLNISKNKLTELEPISRPLDTLDCIINVLDLTNNPITQLLFLSHVHVNHIFVSDSMLCCWMMLKGSCNTLDKSQTHKCPMNFGNINGNLAAYAVFLTISGIRLLVFMVKVKHYGVQTDKNIILIKACFNFLQCFNPSFDLFTI